MSTGRSASIEGGCACGQVRFEVVPRIVAAGWCHCRLCQRSSGAPAVAWAEFPVGGFRFTAGTPTAWKSSTHSERLHCPHCHSYLAFRAQTGARTVSINTACLDDPSGFPPTLHIFAGTRQPWFPKDDLPAYDDYGPV
jgi:hypothetical protein